MRRIWLAASLCTAGAVAGCSFNTSGVNADDDDEGTDAAVNIVDAAGPDAEQFECTSSTECEIPPTLCQQPGTCNEFTHKCLYPDIDCTGESDECNIGTCDVKSGECIKLPAFESDPCGDGTVCNPFGDCGGFDPGDVCDETGTQSRQCVDYACLSGSCLGSARVETEDCGRDTTGVTCAATACGDFGACGGFADLCDESGTHSRDCTAFACAGAACTAMPFVDTAPCTRPSTDGVTCAPDACGDYGPCTGFEDTCDRTGTRQGTCTPFSCAAETCSAGAPFPHFIPCSRTTDGDKCGESCTLECTGIGDCATICTGTCIADCEDVLCSGGTCGG
jgi:hypothetical protein